MKGDAVHSRLTAAAAEEALAAANEAAKSTAELVAPRVPKDLPPAKWMPWYPVRGCCSPQTTTTHVRPQHPRCRLLCHDGPRRPPFGQGVASSSGRVCSTGEGVRAGHRFGRTCAVTGSSGSRREAGGGQEERSHTKNPPAPIASKGSRARICPRSDAPRGCARAAQRRRLGAQGRVRGGAVGLVARGLQGRPAAPVRNLD